MDKSQEVVLLSRAWQHLSPATNGAPLQRQWMALCLLNSFTRGQSISVSIIGDTAHRVQGN